MNNDNYIEYTIFKNGIGVKKKIPKTPQQSTKQEPKLQKQEIEIQKQEPKLQKQEIEIQKQETDAQRNAREKKELNKATDIFYECIEYNNRSIDIIKIINYLNENYKLITSNEEFILHDNIYIIDNLNYNIYEGIIVNIYETYVSIKLNTKLNTKLNYKNKKYFYSQNYFFKSL